MYLTAQRVRRADGECEVHSFLHAHDTDYPFPENAAEVALKVPGRLVAKCPTEADRKVEPGGNDVVSYLDIAVRDLLWSPAWFERLRNLADQIKSDTIRRGAWTLGPCYVAFMSDEHEDPAREFASLVAACAPLVR